MSAHPSPRSPPGIARPRSRRIAAIKIRQRKPAVGDRPGCRRASPMRRSCSKSPTARRPATSPKAAARRRRGREISADRPPRFRRKPKQVQSWVASAREANNPLLVEGTFRTGTQSHACLEPHAAVARFDGDGLTVHASTQAVFHLMELIAKRYKLDARQGPRHRRPCRRRLRLEGEPRHGDDRGDRACARGEGAGAHRLRPARGIVGDRLSAGSGNQDRAAAVRRRAS